MADLTFEMFNMRTEGWDFGLYFFDENFEGDVVNKLFGGELIASDRGYGGVFEVFNDEGLFVAEAFFIDDGFADGGFGDGAGVLGSEEVY